MNSLLNKSKIEANTITEQTAEFNYPYYMEQSSSEANLLSTNASLHEKGWMVKRDTYGDIIDSNKNLAPDSYTELQEHVRSMNQKLQKKRLLEKHRRESKKTFDPFLEARRK